MGWPPSTDRARRSWKLFGIPIHIEASWLFIVAFLTWSLACDYFPSVVQGLSVGMYWAMGAASALLLYGCILLHELGHSFVARGQGMPVACITLFLFGGVAQVAGEAKRPSADLAVAVAGPLVSLLIAAGCFAIAPRLPMHTTLEVASVAVVHYLALINTGILFFNLLPGFPLDGGRIARAALWAWTGSLPQATRVASAIGLLLGLGFMGLGGWAILHGARISGLWYLLIGWFLRGAAQQSFYAAQLMERHEAVAILG